MLNQTLRKSAVAFCLLILAPLAAVAQDEQMPPENPVEWSLKAPPQTVKAGSTFAVKVTARPEKGWYLYSLDQEEGGPIPTRIRLPAGQLFESAGDIESPTPRVKFDKNFGINTEYYEGEVTFTLPVKVAAGAPAGRHKLSVQARYQSCNDSLCLPPKLVKLEAEITIEANK